MLIEGFHRGAATPTSSLIDGILRGITSHIEEWFRTTMSDDAIINLSLLKYINTFIWYCP